MQTTDHPAATTTPRRPHRATSYYLGRKADIWLAAHDRAARVAHATTLAGQP
jgi:hypothetical protein